MNVQSVHSNSNLASSPAQQHRYTVWYITHPLCPCCKMLHNLCLVLAAVPIAVSVAKPVVFFYISQVTFYRLYFLNCLVSALLETSAK